MQALFEWDFRKSDDSEMASITRRHLEEFAPGLEDASFTRVLVEGTLAHRKVIDQLIEKCAPEWPLDQVTVIDRNVLRLEIGRAHV